MRFTFFDMEGYIKIFRSLLDWEWYGDANVLRVFLHCLLSANYQERKWQGVVVGRGQLVTSVSKLSEQLNLTPKQIRLSLDKLTESQNVAIKGTNKYSIITICNYDTYQDVNIHEGQAEGQTKDKQRANKGQTKGNNIINKEIKEGNNYKESNTTVLPKKFDVKDFLLSMGVDAMTADAWLQVRRAKRATNTELAMNLIDKEVTKAGITWQEAISECVLRNWQGFKAEWLRNEQQSGRGRSNTQWTEEELREMREFREQLGI